MSVFESIFVEAFSQVQSNMLELLTSERFLLEKIEMFIDQYLDILSANPYLPAFVTHEINRNPEKILALIRGTGLRFDLFNTQIDQEIENGSIWPVNPQHLIINIMALCAFPFVAKPLLDKLIFGNVQQQIDEFTSNRKVEIKNLIIRNLKKQL